MGYSSPLILTGNLFHTLCRVNVLIPTRFQAVKGRIHSSGGVYLTILNLPRDIRYLEENTILLMIIRGPWEPSLEQLNECMDPIALDLNDMYKGL